MRAWLRAKLRAWLGVDTLDAESVRCAKAILGIRQALADEARELRKDIVGARTQRDYARPALKVLSWEQAQEAELEKLQKGN